MDSPVNLVAMVDLVKLDNLANQAEKACKDPEAIQAVMVFKVHQDLREELSTKMTIVNKAKCKVHSH